MTFTSVPLWVANKLSVARTPVYCATIVPFPKSGILVMVTHALVTSQLDHSNALYIRLEEYLEASYNTKSNGANTYVSSRRSMLGVQFTKQLCLVGSRRLAFSVVVPALWNIFFHPPTPYSKVRLVPFLLIF